jgi:excisionase family DNA binding protein
MTQTFFIPTREDLQKIVSDAVRQTVNEALPGAIRKATRKKWLTTDEAIEFLQCSRRHLQYLRDSGKLPFNQNGRTIRYDIEQLEAYLSKGKVNQGAEA